MAEIERDPAGLLERIPELRTLAAHSPALARAIEHGRAHAAYRALYWLKLSGKAKPHAELVQDLLARRRLFIQPLKGAPRMFTMNGVGSTIYGQAERDDQDGTHIKTLFLVLVFVPVYPFSAYLVRQNAERTNSWHFFGKVPLSTPLYLWQRALALAGVVAVVLGAFNAVGAMRYNTVRVANALPVPVEVRIAGQGPLKVAGGELASMRAKVGKQPIEVRAGNRVIEQGTIDVRRGYDVVVWNVLGAAVLYQERVPYAAKGTPQPEPDKPTLFCGEQNLLLDGINFAFEAPPHEISMGEHESVSYRSHVDFVKAGEFACVGVLAQDHKLEQAGALAGKLAAASDYDLTTTAAAATFLERHAPAAACALAQDALKQHDDSVEHHRLYQNYLLLEGRQAELLTTYRARAAAHPDSADAQYLLSRLLHGDEAKRFDQAALARFPKHPYLLRGAAFNAMRDQDPAAAERIVDSLRPLDQRIWQESLDLELRALAQQGSLEKARSILTDVLQAPDLAPSERFELVVDGLELARFMPAVSEGELLARLGDDDPDDLAELRVHARLNAACQVTPEELAKLKREDARKELELELLAHTDPNGALGRIAQSDVSLARLSTASATLLLAEAARRDEHHPAIARLSETFPYGRPLAAALTRYARSGEVSDELDESSGDVHAAAHFVRARAAQLKPAEQRDLLARAAREDALRGPVSVAMREWPPP